MDDGTWAVDMPGCGYGLWVWVGVGVSVGVSVGAAALCLHGACSPVLSCPVLSCRTSHACSGRGRLVTFLGRIVPSIIALRPDNFRLCF